MNSGLQSGFTIGLRRGLETGLASGLQSAYTMKNNLNSIAPNAIKDPKLRPVAHINGENVTLLSGAVRDANNVIDPDAGQLMAYSDIPFQQTTGTTYRPPLVRGGLGGRNYMSFSDTGNRYLINPAGAAMYSQTAPNANGTGITLMYVIRRKDNASTYSIFDGRDSTSVPTTGDLLVEINPAGRITFDYRGGVAGSVTSAIGTAGVDLLNQWSILTIKCQLRVDGGAIPVDGAGPVASRRYAFPSGARIGSGSAIDIFVNGVEQQKTFTTNTFTNADHFGDGSFRMLDRDLTIGNKGIVYGTSGTDIASVVIWPCYIDKALQTRVENYFRSYYSMPF